MKKILLIIGTLGVIALILFVLVRNRKKIDEKNKHNVNQTEFPVNAVAVSLLQLTEELQLTGTTIGFNDVMVASETQGRIKSCNIQIGSRVGKGSVMYEVDSELRQAQFNSAQAGLEKAKQDLDRAQSLLRENSGTKAQHEAAVYQMKSMEAQLAIATKQLADTKIVSPISGVVTNKLLDIGAQVNTGVVVANVVDISRLKVKLGVSETDVFKLKRGDKVKVTFDVYAGVETIGTIISIGEKGDESHTYPVEVQVANNSTHPLKAGMFATVYFSNIEKGESLVIPRECVIGSVRSASVFVVEENVVRLKSVVLGESAGGKIEVLSGLRVGESVVSTGQSNLSDGYKVRVVESHSAEVSKATN